MSHRYEIVTYDPVTGWDRKTTDDIYAFMKAAGAEQTGTAPKHLRAELQGEPKFSGFLGPMWGGPETPVRYENRGAYDALSA